MKIIPKENVYKDYKDANLTVFKYWEQVEKDRVLSKEELKYAKKLTDTIYSIRQNKAVDEIFIDMFTVNNQNNTYNLGSFMGADIGGIETKDFKVIFMNVEMGVNIHLNNPKSEDVHKYLKVFELFNLGLENVEQFRKVLNYYNFDETYKPKQKTKQQKI